MLALLPLLASPSLPEPAELQLTYLANEGFLCRSGEDAVLFDAFVSEPYAGYAALPEEVHAKLVRAEAPFDAVDVAITSHVHGDHFQPEPACAFLAAAPGVLFVSSPQVVQELAERCPAPEGEAGTAERARRRALDPARGHTAGIEHGDVRVDAFPLSHGPGRFAGIQNLGHVVRLGGFRILHLGDAHMDPRNFAPYELPTLELDVALVPYWYFGSTVGEVLLSEHLEARLVVAMHVPPGEVQAVRTALARSHPDVVVFTEPLATRSLAERPSTEPATPTED